MHAVHINSSTINSVRVQDFKLRGQCEISKPKYWWYPLLSGKVNGAHIKLTGRQRDINGQ